MWQTLPVKASEMLWALTIPLACECWPSAWEKLQRILRLFMFTNSIVFELLVLWCSVFLQILFFDVFLIIWVLVVFVLTDLFFWIMAVLQIFLVWLLNRSFNNMSGIIAIPHNLTSIIGNLRHGSNIKQYYY